MHVWQLYTTRVELASFVGAEVPTLRQSENVQIFFVAEFATCIDNVTGQKLALGPRALSVL